MLRPFVGQGRPEKFEGGFGGAERANANDFVASVLGGEIIAGVYPEGARMPPEPELLNRFGVSRSTLREAFRTLAGKHLIVSRQKVGAVVQPKSTWNVLDPELMAWRIRLKIDREFLRQVHELREMVEPYAASLAAAAQNPAAIMRIADAYEKMEACAGSAGDMNVADYEFHKAIIDAAGNPYLAALGKLKENAVRATFDLSYEADGFDFAPMLNEHKALLLAIQAKAPVDAAARTHDLLKKAAARQLKVVDRGA